MAKCKKYEEGGKVYKDPEDIVADIERRQNKEDLELPIRVGNAMVSRLKDAANVGPMAAKAVANKVKEDLTGGAYTGARLNMPSNTRLGKLSAADTRLLNKFDENKRQSDTGAELYERKGKTSDFIGKYKKGGVVKSSASKRADGCAVRGKTKGRMV